MHRVDVLLVSNGITLTLLLQEQALQFIAQALMLLHLRVSDRDSEEALQCGPGLAH
jgi:hypothetical protein